MLTLVVTYFLHVLDIDLAIENRHDNICLRKKGKKFIFLKTYQIKLIRGLKYTIAGLFLKWVKWET